MKGIQSKAKFTNSNIKFDLANMELSNSTLTLEPPDQEFLKMIVKQGLPLLFQYIKDKDKLDLEDGPLKVWLENVTTDDISKPKSNIMNVIKLARRETDANQANIQLLENEREDLNMRIDATCEEYNKLKCTYTNVAKDWQKGADELRKEHEEKAAELSKEKEELDREIQRMQREYENKLTEFDAEVEEDNANLAKRHKDEDEYYQKLIHDKRTEHNEYLLERDATDASIEELKIALVTSKQNWNKLALDGQAMYTFGAGPLDQKDGYFVLKHMQKELVSELINDANKKMIKGMNGHELDQVFRGLKNLGLHENSSFKSCTSDQDVGRRICVGIGHKEILSERKIRAVKVCTPGGKFESNSYEVREEFSELIEEIEMKKKGRTSSATIKSPARYFARTPTKLPSLKRSSSVHKQEEESTPMKKRRFNTLVTSPIRTPPPSYKPIRTPIRTPNQNALLSLKQAPSSSVSRLSMSKSSMGGAPVSDPSLHE